MTQIKSKLFPAIQLLFLLLLTASILGAPGTACSYAALALQLWFEKMIPSLFPFMILSGLIVRLDFSRLISAPVYPLLGRIYKISKTMCTTMLLGFLFGFPLGAKTIAEQYSFGQLSKSQAQYLLSFCNNIGPVYLLSFALPLLSLSDDPENSFLKYAVIFIYFGIPLLYGLVLRYTACRNADFSLEYTPASIAASRLNAKIVSTKQSGYAPLSAASSSAVLAPKHQIISASENQSFISALDASVTSACAAITRLGGYMIFFIVCNLLFEKAPSFVKILPVNPAAFLSPVLEITSGLALSKDILPPALLMTMITFGGLSCFAQTYTCIRDTDLSFGNYCHHKILQSIIAFFLYAVLFSGFSARSL
ncbi:MAG: hypothetical protein HDQ96_10855 [Lachnospiraceae bacterium]|nr:hypothetical protein [Lachnospiraceae bacterium]